MGEGRRGRRVLIGVLAVSGLALLAGLPSVAAAETKVKTVPGEVVFLNKNRPNDPGNCSAVVFVMWKNPPLRVDAIPIAWKVFYEFKGVKYSRVTAPPFNDVTKYVAEYRVPDGKHWLNVGYSSVDGSVPNDCSSKTAKYKELFSVVARVEITLDLKEPPIDQAKCKAARAGLRARNKAVGKQLGKLRKASTPSAKSRIRENLAKAKVKRAQAAQRVNQVCT
jgi:hypothetical protein